VLHAFCIWDGGRLAATRDILYAWSSDENRTYPWGNSPAPDWQDALGNRPYSTWRALPNGSYVWPLPYLDRTAYMASPGRRPMGNGKWGHSDLIGPVLTFTTTNAGTAFEFVWTGSTEGHGVSKSTSGRDATWAYWMAGGRCAR
jgi:hypothetical protein